MRNITRASIALIGAVALTGVTVTSASAATGDSTTTASVDSGILAITVSPTILLESTGPGVPATGTVDVTVTDTRAGILGWASTMHITDFAPSANGTVIPATSLTYTTPQATLTQSAVTPTAVTRGGTDANGVIVPTAALADMAVHTATGVAGNNIASWTAALSLAVPATAIADDYLATLTHSVLE